MISFTSVGPLDVITAVRNGFTVAPAERQRVLDALHEPRLADLAPATVYITLLDEGTYHCS